MPGKPNTKAESAIHLVDEHEAAEILRLSVITLRKWRSERKGPRYCKLGACVRYEMSALREFVDAACAA